MVSLKLKFKIETIVKLNKNSEDAHNINKLQELQARLGVKPSSAKNSLRASKSFNNQNDIESLPGFNTECSILSPEDKEELLNLAKNIDYLTLSSICQSLQNKQFYNQLKTQNGLEIIKQAYKEFLKIKTEFNSNNLNIINFQDNLVLTDECELYLYLKDILNLTELDSIEIFDLFKFNEFLSFTEQNFIILIYLLAAYECGKMEDFFQIFNEEIFIFISGEQKIINLSRLKEIGRLLKFNERTLSMTAFDLGMESSSLIDASKFKEYYLILSKTFDDSYKESNSGGSSTQTNFGTVNKSSQMTNSSGKSNIQQGKTNTGCMSKACNIL
jgi:hypothetical protein